MSTLMIFLSATTGWILFVIAALVLFWTWTLFRSARDTNEIKYPDSGKVKYLDDAEDAISK